MASRGAELCTATVQQPLSWVPSVPMHAQLLGINTCMHARAHIILERHTLVGIPSSLSSLSASGCKSG